MIDLAAWVEAEPDPGRRQFRQAIQLVLRGIAQAPDLSPLMIMKGGVLLAIRYGSSRFTRDIDFSTSRHVQDVDIERLLTAIGDALAPVSADNEYGLALRLQSHELKPPVSPRANFPTLKMRIGYASRLETRQIARLESRNASNTVQVDYSFNEWASEVETQEMDGGRLSMYPYHDLIAEKLRSILQQPSRRRERYQDVYDLWLLLQHSEQISADDRAQVLAKLRASAVDREVPIHRRAMGEEAVMEMSRRQYEAQLPGLVAGDVPPFDPTYALVRDFYESLPWGPE